jgi:HSP20 family protein
MEMASRGLDDWLWGSSSDLQLLSEELSSSRPKVAGSRYWEPRVDVFEEEHRFLLRAELPGVDPENIQLLYVPERHAIQLKGVRIDDFNGEKVGIHQLEIMYGEFQREITLPNKTVDAGAIRAHYRNGFLLVLVPKLERIKISRQISIKSL